MLGSAFLGLVGDLEDDRDWAVGVLRMLGQRGDVDVVCQLGDFRFDMGADPEGYLDAIETVCAEFDLRLLCINRSHENWARLDQMWPEPSGRNTEGNHKPLDVSDHVTLIPRGHRWH